MSRKNKYTKSFKYRAVQYVLKNKLGVTHVCDKFGVSNNKLDNYILLPKVEHKRLLKLDTETTNN